MAWTKVASLEAAERAATKEAADTEGIAAPIHAIEVGRDKSTMIIALPQSRIAPSSPTQASGRPTISPVGIGGVYVAPAAAYVEEVFGFIVLRGPFRLVTTNDSWNDDDPC